MQNLLCVIFPSFQKALFLQIHLWSKVYIHSLVVWMVWSLYWPLLVFKFAILFLFCLMSVWHSLHLCFVWLSWTDGPTSCTSDGCKMLRWLFLVQVASHSPTLDPAKQLQTSNFFLHVRNHPSAYLTDDELEISNADSSISPQHLLPVFSSPLVVFHEAAQPLLLILTCEQLLSCCNSTCQTWSLLFKVKLRCAYYNHL